MIEHTEPGDRPSCAPSPGRRARLAALLIAAVIVVIVGLRLALDGIQPYGADGAQYIEHAARLAVLGTVQDQGLFPPWGLLVATDGAFPPLMHLVTLGPGALSGHGAGSAAATGVGWLLLLAFAVGWSTAGLTGRSSLAAPAAAAVLLLPAAHGLATRYYYDLPMIALLWLAVAVVLAGRDDRPLLAGGAAGLLLFGAAITKWAALAFGPPMILGALLTGWSRRGPEGARASLRRRLACGLVCSAVAALLCVGFVAGRGTDNSFAAMGRVAFAEGSPDDWEQQADAPGALDSALGQLEGRAGRVEAADLAFYPLRLVTSVFSIPLALLLAILLVRWGRRGREGLALVLVVGLGHGLFLLGVMPVLDDRFAVVGAPALVVAATCAWAGLEPRRRTQVAAAVIAVGLAVAVDFHFAGPAPWNVELQVLAPDRDDFPPTSVRGLGLGGSVEGRGWSRHDETPSPRQALRDATWQAVLRCGAAGVGVRNERPLIAPDGDAEWLRYRALLSRIGEGLDAPTIGGVCPHDGRAWDGDGPLDLVLTSERADLPACLEPWRWRRAERLEDPSGGAGVEVWVRRDGAVCR